MTTTLPTWHHHAACGGKAQLMYPRDGDKAGIAAARRLCASCPVFADCARWARSLRPEADPGGVLAGRTEDERLAGRIRVCTGCGESLPVGAFALVRRQGRLRRRARCRYCLRAEKRAWYQRRNKYEKQGVK